jgi:hypothetical protein
MSLDLPSLIESIDRISQDAARPAAQRALEQAGRMDPRQRETRLAAAGESWSGARPTEEPLEATFPPPEAGVPSTVIGADGSQIHPDRHSPTLYYLINVGGIALHPGSRDPPKTTHRPVLHHGEEDLYGEDDELISTALLSGRRDLDELRLLAELATGLPPGPTLALLDNGLLLWAAVQERDRTRADVQRLLKDYLGVFSQLREAHVSLAGFIDRPRHAGVLDLLHLLTAPDPSQADRRSSPFRGLTDRDLFHRLLPPGHRSPRFALAHGLGRTYQAAGHPVGFFYLHTGYGDQIARVEVPQWVGADPELLACVHAGILDQCRFAGQPYVLIRAHELALVTASDRAALDGLLQRALLEQGLPASVSQKAQTKRWAARRPRSAGRRR